MIDMISRVQENGRKGKQKNPVQKYSVQILRLLQLGVSSTRPGTYTAAIFHIRLAPRNREVPIPHTIGEGINKNRYSKAVSLQHTITPLPNPPSSFGSCITYVFAPSPLLTTHTARFHPLANTIGARLSYLLRI